MESNYMESNYYTYTARNANNPKQVATFTLIDNRLTVDFGSALLGKTEIEVPSTNGINKVHFPVWLKPIGIFLLQRGLPPFNVADVNVSAQDEGLSINAWIRAGGLRLLPAILNWKQVDNPEAAQAFAGEVKERKVSHRNPGKFPGPFDYWAGWGLISFLLLGLMWTWRRSND